MWLIYIEFCSVLEIKWMFSIFCAFLYFFDANMVDFDMMMKQKCIETFKGTLKYLHAFVESTF
jgi:hypothetical protein